MMVYLEFAELIHVDTELIDTNISCMVARLIFPVCEATTAKVMWPLNQLKCLERL
jgi:hypothetical protein